MLVPSTQTLTILTKNKILSFIVSPSLQKEPCWSWG